MRNIALVHPSSRFLLWVVALLVTPTLTCAKWNVNVEMNSTSDRISTELREGIEARINSTDRYAIAANAREQICSSRSIVLSSMTESWLPVTAT